MPPSLPPLTVDAAAKALGISADAVRKRIARGKLLAEKDAAGQWRVYLNTPPPDAAPDSGTDRTRHAPRQDRTADSAAQADLQADNAALRAQLADMQRDRDAWRDQAQAVTTALQQQQALALPDRMAAMPAIEARPGVWQRVKAFLTRRL